MTAKTEQHTRPTPRPWTVGFSRRRSDSRWRFSIEGAADEAHEANARLIAAAPLMLEALEFTAEFARVTEVRVKAQEAIRAANGEA